MDKKDIEEDDSSTGDFSDPVGGLKDNTPQDVLDASELESNNSYDDVIEEDPELKTILEYRRLLKKIKEGEELTPQEQAWKQDIERLHLEEQQAQETQEQQANQEKEKQLRLQEEVNRQYKETKEKNPGSILKAVETEAVLTGSESIPKILGLVFKLKKARKKGGKVIVQVFRNRKVVLKWTRNDVSFIEFWSKDEKGNDLIEVTRFSEHKYMFEGTPIPVLFAVQGYAEGFDFFSEFRKDLTSEIVSRLVMRSYIAGYTKGAEIRQKEKKPGMLDSLQPLMPIIIIGGFILIAYLLYTMYGEMQDMIAAMDALKVQLEAAKSIAQVVGP